MKKWLFNPFEFIAGWTSLLAGVLIILSTAVAAFYGNTHLDGVLDQHVGGAITFNSCLLEGLADWLSMALFIYLAGLLFSKSSIRLLDVLGTQALARFPVFISCLVTLLCFDDKMLAYLEYKLLHKGMAVEVGAGSFVLFGIMLLVTLLTTVWNVVLMYRAYSVACNVKGSKSIFSFTGALLFAEVLSKILVNCF